ncbi:MAG TPA: RNA polymerase subunit sigma-70 [Hydrogenophaga sp.]|jgi:RNA polymerase sigma-70 factor (ECF subfamily)|uniref:sigma-70 family RNA polymerase sigma factor n=1 Tax=Hydrogenophaga TaxID=47420 RepID=UPI0008CD56C2|nr:MULTISPECIES: sigma-70 family RNA polymerase sigma factor [Hydrogenophaga]MBU4184065.1 sigma-70 family RNA polymerase sigma factor [Gammaproteobacteria bacterium]OGA79581.1 MAG: RNA polymerase subunit sigma-70 [Burkholderiales bacterium GWE1_65_30]OGA92764.1 MAG: RNA polymerase subunit sigma-70 [Burkholderiales bacterium GWF1_66_17]PKO78724.1 MAG: RNA polymerase subunit sigma-70 [Betaproteobacteria bacterium HGW-Betaproteobacteria-15]MBU4280369.1 sigma-70 family RNA polymerase sigma factor 
MSVDRSASFSPVLAIWSQHEAELRRWLLSRAPVKSEVDDLLQDVFLKTLKQGDHFAAIAQPRAWLFEVTRNTLTDRLRVSRDSLPLPEGLDELPAPVEHADPVDTLAQACLPRVLSELDPQDREAIQLCDLQGMEQGDFARLKNLSLPAAKSRVQRARKRMRERMTTACQVSFDDVGRVDDFVPRPPLPAPVAPACCDPQEPKDLP